MGLRRWTRRGRVAGLAVVVLALHSIAGCGLSPSSDTFLANVHFQTWGTLEVDGATGYLTNDYIGKAENVSVTLYYATGASEHPLTVAPDPPRVDGFGGTSFRAAAQVTAGELRYPRVGQVRWKGGSSPAQPRRPNLVIDSSWCFFGTDSAMGRINDYGGRAYHVVVAVNGKNGVQSIDLGSNWGAPFSTVRRDSAGQEVVPQVLKIRWEDYGGLADSVVSPVFAHAWRACPFY